MLRIVVADDEYWVRRTLVSMLEESDVSLEIVGEAQNGLEMAEVIEDKKPNLVFADIKMPGLSGLDGISLVKKHHEDILWVAISGYSDFEYAKDALCLGALDYLIKPVSSEILQKALQKAMMILTERNQGRCLKFKQDIMDMHYGMEYGHYYSEQSDGIYTGIIFYYDTILNKEEQIKYHRCLYDSLLMELEKIRTDYVTGVVYIAPSGNLILALKLKDYNEEENSRVVDYICESVIKELQRISCEEFMITAFCIKHCNSQNKLINELEAIQNIVCLRVMEGIGKIYYQADVKRWIRSYEQSKVEICRYALQYMSDLKKGIYREIKEDIKQLKIVVEKTNLNQRERTILKMFLESVSRRKGENLEQLLNENESIIAESVIQNKEKVSTDAKNSLIEFVKEYVKDHYMEDIGVTGVAEIINVTPNYLSSLFRRQEQVTFVKYLTNIRMEHAKKNLSVEKEIKDVAASVGYMDVGYFIKVFKACYGITPKEYIKMQWSKKIVKEDEE